MDNIQEPQGPPRPTTFSFCIIGDHGRVESTGTSSMLPPDIPGKLVLQEIAPADSYWNGTGFVPLGAPGSPYETYDWPTHSWVDLRTLADRKRALMVLATSRRYEAETAGIILADGTEIKTAPEDRARLGFPLANPMRPRETLIDFKAASGWTAIPLSALESIADSVDQYIQECFSTERQHHEAIAVLHTEASAADYDINLNWPSRQR